MKKPLIIIVALTLMMTVGAFMLSQLRQKIDSALSSAPSPSQVSITPTPTFTQAKEFETGLFVPYWSLDEDSDSFVDYDTVIYFGVAANEKGLVRSEEGFSGLSQFLSQAEGKDKYFTIRMINSDTNFSILKSETSQKQIVQESISLAREHGFEGIILNLELSALPFDSLIEQITSFSTLFYDQASANNLEYAITAYGDTFYRVRPFDIEKLSKKTDKIYIMAYDFHKAKGNPGPNFPLTGKEKYGYDFQTMVDGFLEYLPPEKITVIFGLYGYDWQVDEDGVSQDIAESISLLEAQQNLITGCAYLSCRWERDIVSGEIMAEYNDSTGAKHTVWFEDMESVKRKNAFLKSRGIGSVAYWAHSYF